MAANQSGAGVHPAQGGSGAAVPWPSSPRGWLTVVIFFVTAILSYTDRLIFSLLVDPVRNSLGISDFQVGLAQGTSFAIIYALAGLPAGRLADIANRRNLLLIGIIIWSTGTVLCGLATGMASLIVARIFVAAGEAILAPTAISMISDLFPQERRGRPMAVFLSGMNVGSGLAIVIGGGVLTLAQSGAFNSLGGGHFTPWRTTLVLIGLLGFPVLALLLLIREPQRRAGQGQWKRPFTVVLNEMWGRWRRLLPIFVALAALAAVDFALISWTPTLLLREFSSSAWEISNGFGLVVLICGFLGTVIGGFAADRLFIRGGNVLRLRFAAVLGLSGGLSLILLTTATAGYVVALSGFWLFVSAVATICGIATAQDIVPDDARGLCISFISMGNISLGLGVGASLPGALTSGVIVRISGLSWAIAAAVVPLALMAALLFGASNRTPQGH
ncbi:MFS transporter [Nitrospirillum amazonense]|uniref:MFS transporter n=1 Tax=Nitrospirillum amazonense TaxID=28077 RepID=UPI0024126DE2|nr:MFS transporter [Nitrospirillum amazonense]MDG3439127.1 MFS transporter [Nitrospirillum amazonense]